MINIEANTFNTRWETDVYARARQINRYPFSVFIGPFMSLFGRVPDRKAINVIEIGCGAGNNIWFFSREGFSAHGIDGSASALDYARERLAAEALTADLHHGHFQNLPFADATMDFALDRAAITHNTRPIVEASITEAWRVLKPGGAFFSQMFTTDHSDLQFARDFTNGSASDFSDGYFAEIGRTFFANRADIDELFGKRFDIKSIKREIIEDAITGNISATWNLLMNKTG
jgi:ubiquinone/menaquinone biosynthesis C-methylase UbiE